MSPFVANLLLALVWLVITGGFSLANLIFGFLLGGASLYLIREQVGAGSYFQNGRKVASLILFLIYDLAVSAWRVAVVVMRPKLELKPGVFLYRHKVRSEFQIALLSNLVGLTPGTLIFDISDDERTLFVHAFDCSDPDARRREISEGFERRILELSE
ncbi:Na+/H+ antiporter subunit E [Aureimonas phyllosphaerae]|uniref:Multicomponent Na+:H+ antiporter subunit E n=1 Tax=Aureimonas phyllosphaerae TaxID=1166078 RepID=A0A7W6FTV9_9HYPH|nr:Na+/H+ antiporter subunit E [Aureimonas phyllosphaerae]MBB3935594.1 multicomponent Na+:H+ antiporter subunit E [Aureimonas phyllosphaerae]MBB3959602.1 multicomponent Na+:H+ antiporter subunit E [Aureimonas phyllosphaerae]SFF12737.1 multicomponent Na+:H+ antiporter subunit E [Aureimonas phyllosphaerae]